MPRHDKKELFAKAKEMMAKGQTPYSVAHELNIPTTTLHNWIHTPEKEEVRPDAATLKAQYDKAGIGCIARENHIGWVKAKEWAIEAGIDVSKPKKAIPYRHKPKPSEVKAEDKPIRSMGCVEPYIQPIGVEVPQYEPEDNDFLDDEPILRRVAEDKSFDQDAYKLTLIDCIRATANCKSVPSTVVLDYIKAVLGV